MMNSNVLSFPLDSGHGLCVTGWALEHIPAAGLRPQRGPPLPLSHPTHHSLTPCLAAFYPLTGAPAGVEKVKGEG